MTFDPGKIYQKAVDAGCEKASTEERKEYLKKRKSSIKSDATVIVSPSRSSFYLDMGGGVRTFQGQCHRQSYLSDKDAIVTNKGSVNGLRRMAYGQIFESQEHLYEKLGGILIDKNMRLEKKITDNVTISGELDTLANLDSHKYIVEIKSYDGYYGIRHVQGNKSRRGMPKYDHIAQNMYYLAMIKDHPEHNDTEGVLFHYRTRSDMTATFHKMTFKEVMGQEGKIIDAYPVINDIEYNFISMKDLMTRSIQLAEYITADKLPPRDPSYQYSEDEIKYLLEMGEVSKSRFQNWQAGKQTIGDWQCSRIYCPFFNLCMGATPENKDSLPSDDDIMNKMIQPVVDTTTNWTNDITGKYEDAW